MLAPPPENSSDRTALEPEGKQHYLQSLENRLKKLEGRDGKLTSKDMLSALSEARDDHLTSNNNDTSSYVNEYAEWERESEENRVTDTTCCFCFSGRGYLRVGSQRRRQFNMEEYSCLVDCDELELTHDASTNNTNNDQTFDSSTQSMSSSRNDFDDNFVTD